MNKQKNITAAEMLLARKEFSAARYIAENNLDANEVIAVIENEIGAYEAGFYRRDLEKASSFKFADA